MSLHSAIGEVLDVLDHFTDGFDVATADEHLRAETFEMEG